MSDTLLIDGRINTIISGILVQRLALLPVLDELGAIGEVWYGLNVSQASCRATIEN